MNHVTFETAVRLKDAGFPQPEPSFGQAWYYPTWDESPKFFIEKRGWWFMATINSAVHLREHANYPTVYAPTATDILRELDENHFLTTLLDGRFCVALFVGSGDSIHNNPAEACAAAWIALNEKQE